MVALPRRFQRVRTSLIRQSFALAILAFGVVGVQAAEETAITVSEELCLSCAFEQGLIPSASTAIALDADDSAASDTEADISGSFGSQSSDRARLTLPTRSSDRSERPTWSKADKTLLWSYVSLSAIDAYQTMNAPGGVAEANPLIASWAGDHPSALETIAFKGATTYAMYKLAGKIKNRGKRRVALVLMNVIQASVVANNESVTGGTVF